MTDRTDPPPASGKCPGLSKSCSRRRFLQGATALLGGTVLGSRLEWALSFAARAEAGELSPAEAFELSRPENILYTSCLQCLSGCGIKVRLRDGLAVRIDGSPYSPFTLSPHLPMKTPLAEAARKDAPICPKGHAGLQAAYDPYRITKVLKRAGKRGEGKWITVPFGQAIAEIVEGGKLFAHVPGEEDRHVEGLESIYALRDPDVAKAMAADAQAIAKAKDKREAVAEFRRKHAAHLHLLIDPDHPDLGPRNNQLAYMWGRKRGGRTEFAARFFNDYFGTVNNHSHTSACVGSVQFAGKAMNEQYDGGGFSGGAKGYWGGDTESAECILFVGANLFDANFGPVNRGVRLTQRLVEGKVKVTAVDPRFSKLAAKATRYLPVVPGEDGAFLEGVIRWMIRNGRYDAKYLSCANKAAARAIGEPTWTNAALLVKIGADGIPGKFLRASEIGLAVPETRKDKAGRERRFEHLVAMKDGRPVAVDPDDDRTPVTGDLLADTEIGGIRVKSGLRIVAEAAERRTMEEWSALCGIPVADIEAVARELSDHGKKAFVEVGRGASMHVNGFHNVLLAMTVNLLLGNFDHKGGMVTASTYGPMGGKEGQPFDLAKMTPGKTVRFGTSIVRHDGKYEDSTLFSGYPAKRNWYPLAADLYHEVLPSAADGYPYPLKALFTYTAAPTYSLAAGHKAIGILADVGKIPLYFTCDILVGPTTAYADYIFPDLSYLERWEMHGSQQNMPARVQPIRQPVIAPIPETVTVFGEEMPCSYEALLMALAGKLGMKGFGKDGFGKGADFTRPDDFYLRLVANIAADGEPVPDADDAEMRLFLESRRHLPRSVFDPGRWERTTGESWRKAVHVLNRGGRSQESGKIYQGELLANRYGKGINLYQEKTAMTRYALTGKPVPGYATYVPVTTALGRTPREEGLTDRFPLHLVSHKDITQTQSRTIHGYWLLGVRPENEILVHPSDAERLGFRSGDRVRVVSATNRKGIYDLGNGKKKEMAGKVKVTETIRPGVVSFSIGHGHWASGSSDIVIDGTRIPGDPRRAGGVNANAAMWTDPYLKNTCLIDPVGGSVSYYDTRVDLVRA